MKVRYVATIILLSVLSIMENRELFPTTIHGLIAVSITLSLFKNKLFTYFFIQNLIIGVQYMLRNKYA